MEKAGPNLGAAGLRALTGAETRALTSGALKPQGLPPAGLAAIAGRLATGGIDLIKDDHGLADQPYSPFTARVDAVMDTLDSVAARIGHRTHYLPSLAGNLDDMRRQIRHAMGRGVAAFLIAPIIAGIPTFATLVREFPSAGFMTTPPCPASPASRPPCSTANSSASSAPMPSSTPTTAAASATASPPATPSPPPPAPPGLTSSPASPSPPAA